MTERLQRFGYAGLELKENCVLGKSGDSIRIHEFHHSMALINEPRTAFKLTKKSLSAKRNWECGYIKGNGVAGYPHIHFYSNTGVANTFVQEAANYRKQHELLLNG
jgi:cobyrinic acid a,c-diamide synthase